MHTQGKSCFFLKENIVKLTVPSILKSTVICAGEVEIFMSFYNYKNNVDSKKGADQVWPVN